MYHFEPIVACRRSLAKIADGCLLGAILGVIFFFTPFRNHCACLGIVAFDICAGP